MADDSIQSALAFGAPLGEVGHSHDDPDTWPPPGETLYLVTGTLDDVREPASPDSPHYSMAVWAYLHRDAWDDEQARDYWDAHLFAWRAKPVRRRFVETFTYLAAVGLNSGLSEEEVLGSFWPVGSGDELKGRHTLQNEKVMQRAKRHRHELIGGAIGPSFPRVLRRDEFERREILLGRKFNESDGRGIDGGGLWAYGQDMRDEQRDHDHGAPVHPDADRLLRRVLAEQRRMLSLTANLKD